MKTGAAPSASNKSRPAEGGQLGLAPNVGSLLMLKAEPRPHTEQMSHDQNPVQRSTHHEKDFQKAEIRKHCLGLPLNLHLTESVLSKWLK